MHCGQFSLSSVGRQAISCARPLGQRDESGQTRQQPTPAHHQHHMGGGIRGPGNGLGSPWPECVQRLALLDRRGVSRGDFAGVASRQGDGWLPVPRLGEGQFQRWFFSISWFGIAAGRDWRRSHRAGQGRFHHGAVRGVCAADGVGVGPPDDHSNVGWRGAGDGGAVAVEFQSGQ